MRSSHSHARAARGPYRADLAECRSELFQRRRIAAVLKCTLAGSHREEHGRRTYILRPEVPRPRLYSVQPARHPAPIRQVMAASNLGRRLLPSVPSWPGTGAVLASNWLTATAPFAEAHKRHHHRRADLGDRMVEHVSRVPNGGHASPRAARNERRRCPGGRSWLNSACSGATRMGWTTPGPHPPVVADAEGSVYLVDARDAYAHRAWGADRSRPQDADIYEVGQRLATFGHPIYFSFHHEPENDSLNGPRTLAAAFERVRGVMDVWSDEPHLGVHAHGDDVPREKRRGRRAAPGPQQLSPGWKRRLCWPIISKPRGGPSRNSSTARIRSRSS